MRTRRFFARSADLSLPLFLSAIALATATATAAGCGVATPAVTVYHTATTPNLEPVQGDPVKFRRPSQETYATIRDGYYVVRNVDDWRAAFPSGADTPLPATLDLSRQMILLAVAEEKDTIQMQVTKILETGRRVYVFVREVKNGDACALHQENKAFDAVFAPRVDKPVEFRVDTSKGEACGDLPTASVKCRVGNSPTWSANLAAFTGDTVECEASADAKGKFALVENHLSLADLPPGSSTKLVFSKAPVRGAFPIDVFGSYVVQAEAADDSGRRTTSNAKIEVKPPKTPDVQVQLVWTNFDRSDDPETFPRLKLRAHEPGAGGHECSAENAIPELCLAKAHSAYTHMTLLASSKKIPLSVAYVDERVEKGPLACVQLYMNGERTDETCDRTHRTAEQKWQVGIVDMTTGKLLPPAPVSETEADAGAPAAPAPTAAKKPAKPAPAKPKK